jgi:hypothetical protein
VVNFHQRATTQVGLRVSPLPPGIVACQHSQHRQT